MDEALEKLEARIAAYKLPEATGEVFFWDADMISEAEWDFVEL
jgi:hypothetical protein